APSPLGLAPPQAMLHYAALRRWPPGGGNHARSPRSLGLPRAPEVLVSDDVRGQGGSPNCMPMPGLKGAQGAAPTVAAQALLATPGTDNPATTTSPLYSRNSIRRDHGQRKGRYARSAAAHDTRRDLVPDSPASTLTLRERTACSTARGRPAKRT